jgi:hypothetical protein
VILDETSERFEAVSPLREARPRRLGMVQHHRWRAEEKFGARVASLEPWYRQMRGSDRP